MAGVAADPVVDLSVVRNASPIVHAILALVLLLAATVLGVYKPFGLTPYGKGKQSEERQAFSPAASRAPRTAAAGTALWVYAAGIVAIAALLLFVIWHLLGGSLSHH
jgi:hypothetical protein